MKKQIELIFTVEMDEKHITEEHLDTMVQHCDSEIIYDDGNVITCEIKDWNGRKFMFRRIGHFLCP